MLEVRRVLRMSELLTAWCMILTRTHVMRWVYYLIMESMLVVLQRQVSKEKQISYAIFLRCHLCHTSYQSPMTFGGRHGNSYQRIFCINISRIPAMQVIFFTKLRCSKLLKIYLDCQTIHFPFILMLSVNNTGHKLTKD